MKHNDPAILKLTDSILRFAVNNGATEIVYNSHHPKASVHFYAGRRRLEYSEIPADSHDALLLRLIIISNVHPIPPLIEAEPPGYPCSSSFAIELDGVRRAGYGRLFKERGSFVLHLHILTERDQSFFNAVAAKNLLAVETAIANGQDVNVSDYRGNVPLMEAVVSDFIPMVKLLLDNGANINAGSDTGNTPVMIPIYDSRLGMMRFLIEHGADINARTVHGHSSLYWAMIKGQANMARYLIENGAYINVLGPDRTPLVKIAARTMPDDIVKAMIARGAEQPHDGAA